MDEKKLSALQQEYRVFFLDKMKLYGVKSPTGLTKTKKSKFFTEIKQGWSKHKLSKKQKLEIYKKVSGTLLEESRQTFIEKEPKQTDLKEQHKGKEWSQQENLIPHPGEKKQQQSDKKLSQQLLGRPVQEFTKQIIKSEPNPEQTDDLRILFVPNCYFAQEGPYQYPVVKMPKQNSSLKLPRLGRSNQKGYKENDFYIRLIENISGIEIDNNVHLVIPNFNRPYEPDIVLFDKSLNLYIDIEIDEPYDGYYRYPTHYLNPEDEVKQDDIRDLFFTESGWIVIRFTEKQVHCQVDECIGYIKNVLSSIYNRDFINDLKCEKENGIITNVSNGKNFITGKSTWE